MEPCNCDPCGPRCRRAIAALILTKHQVNRPSFAILLAFYHEWRRFPRRGAEIERTMVSDIAEQLGLEHSADRRMLKLSGRSVERHRAEIRDLFGFREATISDGEALAE
jgi:hypothetical protein